MGNCCEDCCTKVTDYIIGKFESFFFWLGKIIGKSPYLTILISVVVAGLFGIGMLEFVQENRGEKLWNPQDSEALRHKAIVEQRYPVASRLNIALFESSNVLTSQVLKAMLDLDKEVKLILNGTKNQWDDICYKTGPVCQMSGILDVWGYNETKINGLTDAQILADLNKVPLISPTTRRPISLDRILGAIERNASKITRAGAATLTYFLKNQGVYNKKAGQIEDANGKLWEEAFGKVAEKVNSKYSFVNLFFYSQTAFRAASGSAISGDITYLSAGYFLIIAYLALMLGRFTFLEHKVWLAVIGVLCVGLAILVSFGLSSAIGFFYGPVHSILPFLILGIGVDDVFVIIQSYENIAKKLPKDASLPYTLGATMKHAGVAISVTSMTDVIAFLIGATTVLPALRSFCVYAGFGILAVFFFACTIFAACLALDIKRRGNRRDACCCCITLSETYEPFACSKVDRLQKFFDTVVAKFIVKLPVKIVILLATAGLVAAGTYGLNSLTQNFDFNLFLPPDSDATKYSAKSSQYFPGEGVKFSVYLGDINYFNEQPQLKQVYDSVYRDQYVVKSSVSSWYHAYIEWIKTTKGNTSDVDSNHRPKNETLFYSWLNNFLFATQSGKIYSTDVTFNSAKTKILFSRMHATHIKLKDSKTEIKAMDSIKKDLANVGFSKEAFSYSRFYVGWETNKIIGTELIRNLLLAGACVFLVTLFLLANIWASLMVFSCVVLTLVDVGGMMYFWGLYVDTVTSVMLILAIGLCVDYAAHIGHSFMTASQGTKNDRAACALREIGPAVLNGGMSTFLAFVFLAGSTSYVFKTFFKVFFLVVIFGLFHGLLYFPTLLSLLGPKAYSTAIKEDSERAGSANSVADQREPNGNIAKDAHIEANPYTENKTEDKIQSNGAVHSGESQIDLDCASREGTFAERNFRFLAFLGEIREGLFHVLKYEHRESLFSRSFPKYRIKYVCFYRKLGNSI